MSLIRKMSGSGRCGLDSLSGRFVAYMPAGQDYEIIMPPSEIVFFRLHQQRFLQAAETLGYDQAASARQLLLLHSPHCTYLDEMAEMLTSIPHTPEAGAFAAMDHAYLDEVVLERIIGVLLDSTPNTTRDMPARPHRLALAARDLIEGSTDKPLTIMAVCKELGVSRASLQRGFLQVYGVSPLAYMRLRRLNGARRALGAARDSGTTVAEIAMNWGFFHFARFSRDYRRQFGELPSVTLGKAPPARARGADAPTDDVMRGPQKGRR